MLQRPNSSPVVNLTTQIYEEFDQVVLKIGNAEMKMPYKQAFWMSQHLRVAANAAKAFAGDTSRNWSVVGRLSFREE